MKRLALGFMVVAILGLVLSVPVPARADAQVEAIFARVRQINPGLNDYQADIDIALKARVAFLPYNPTMSGTYYHKRPDKHKLVLEKAPSYVKKYPNIFGWNLPVLEKFNSRVAEQTDLAGQPTWRITMTPKQGMGDIQMVEVWVNRNDYSIPRQVTHYKNNGRLGVDVVYRQTDGFLVFDRMTAEFQFPAVSVSATATATYANYRFNQGLSDEFFKKK
jgi:hypothetical protein